jgi:hypothetical protein
VDEALGKILFIAAVVAIPICFVMAVRWEIRQKRSRGEVAEDWLSIFIGRFFH